MSTRLENLRYVAHIDPLARDTDAHFRVRLYERTDPHTMGEVHAWDELPWSDTNATPAFFDYLIGDAMGWALPVEAVMMFVREFHNYIPPAAYLALTA